MGVSEVPMNSNQYAVNERDGTRNTTEGRGGMKLARGGAQSLLAVAPIYPFIHSAPSRFVHACAQMFLQAEMLR